MSYMSLIEEKNKIGWHIVISRDIQGCYISSAGNSKYIYNKSSICLQVILNKYIYFI